MRKNVISTKREEVNEAFDPQKFIEAIDAIAEEKGLNVSVIISTLEAALSSAYSKYRQSDQKNDQKIEIRINPDTGEITVNEFRKVVEELKNKDTEITLKDALIVDQFAEIGKTIKIKCNPKDFGRIAAQTARQVLTQRLKEAIIREEYGEYLDKVGGMISGTVFKVDGDQIIIRLNDKTDALLPRKHRIPGEKYKLGDVMKFYILEVKEHAKGPGITLSRTHDGLLENLMKLEIPELEQGIIEIKKIVRDPGTRAKVSLVSNDPNVDPVGACVGNGGERIRAISKALKDEKVDIIIFSEDPLIYVKSALSPAQISKVEPVLDTTNAYTAYVYPDQLSLAIGRSGQNVRLAAKLTGYKIDIVSLEPDKMPTLKDIFSTAKHGRTSSESNDSESMLKLKDIFDVNVSDIFQDEN